MEKTMKRSKSLQLSAGVIAVAIATAGFGIPAAAGSAPQSNNVAQGTLIGQCRAVNKKVPVYKQAAATASVVSTLNAETKVTLADTGSSGFIGISSPVSGYVQVANLKLCSGSPTPPPTGGNPTPPPTGGNPTPPPTGNTCRRVVQPLGLAVRKEASSDSVVVGGVANLERVDLTTTPATSKKGADGRNWVQIAKPVAGWVSNGFPGGNSNLTLCP